MDKRLDTLPAPELRQAGRLIHAGMTYLMFVFAKQAGNDFDLIVFVVKEKITLNIIFANVQFFGWPE